MEEFGVSPDYRRRGVATAMVEYMRADAKEKDFTKIELDMWKFNESALEFYESVGFKTYRRYMEMNLWVLISYRQRNNLVMLPETETFAKLNLT